MKHYSPKKQKSKIHSKNTILTFGKYKGDTCREVLKHDPTYLVWCRNNIAWFDTNTDLGEVLDEYEFDFDEHPWDRT